MLRARHAGGLSSSPDRGPSTIEATMQEPGLSRPVLARSFDRALITIGVAGVILGLLEMAALPLDGPSGGLLVGLPFVFWSYLAAGLIAWRRRPSNPFGALVLWVGLTVFLGGVANTEIPALMAVGAVTATLPLAAVVHLLLAFPSGHVLGTPARALVVFGYGFSLLLAAPGYLFDPAGSHPPFTVADRPGVVAISQQLASASGLVVVVVTVVILGARLRRADPRHRRVLTPLFSYGIAVMLFIPFSSLVLEVLLGMDPSVRGGLQSLAVGLLPIAFVYGALRGDFARTGELVELGAWLGSAQSGRNSVRAALGRTLGDPSLTLWFRTEDEGGFVDATGAIPAHHDGVGIPARGWEEICLNGRTIGAIEYDSALITDRALVRTAGNVVAIAVERERLTVELLASHRELTESRERIIDAADRERHRIARNLHDGLQAQLLLLGIEAHRLGMSVDATVPVREGAVRLRRQVDAASDTLRALVHELVPAALIERGLEAAVEDLTVRMPIPARLDAELADGPLPRLVESTAYFVVAEALANVVKHSRATRVSVWLRRDETHVRIRVRDDGIGGASAENGSGVRGLRDRVETLRGRVDIISVDGEGKTLRVELPCVS